MSGLGLDTRVMNATSTLPEIVSLARIDFSELVFGRDNEDITLLESNRVGLTILSEPSLSHEDSVDIGFSDLFAGHCSETHQAFADSLIGEAGSGDGKIRLALQYAFFMQSQK